MLDVNAFLRTVPSTLNSKLLRSDPKDENIHQAATV